MSVSAPISALDRGIQTHQVMELKDGADLEEGKRHRRAARRDDEIAQQESLAQYQLPRRIVEQLGDHRISHQGHHDDFGRPRPQEIFEPIDQGNMRPVAPISGVLCHHTRAS